MFGAEDRKINLRKAASICNNITNHIQNMDLRTTAEIVLDPHDGRNQILDHEEKLKNYLGIYEKLLDILVYLRQEVGKANSKSGVSDLLAEEIKLKKQLALYAKFKDSETRLSKTALQGLINAKREQIAENYYGQDFTFNTSIVSNELKEESINLYVKTKRKLNKINEEILAKNVRTKVVLPGDYYEFLDKLGLY